MKKMLRIQLMLPVAALIVLLGGCASQQIADQASVIEVATFQLKPGVTAEVFRPLDHAVEVEHVSLQPGFVSRESAAGKDGEWLVVVHWRSLNDAEASMNSFASVRAAADFMAKIQPDTMVMKRYQMD